MKELLFKNNYPKRDFCRLLVQEKKLIFFFCTKSTYTFVKIIKSLQEYYIFDTFRQILEEGILYNDETLD